FVPDSAGAPGERNALSCGSIEHKMGIHGNSTCVMNYDGATGWLVGEAHRGLNAMFVMMNEARLAVGVQGLAQSEVAYQNAAAYAKDRLQGRALTGTAEPDKPADPIIVHPDVRRNLLMIRAFNEAARALCLWTALSADVAHRSEDAGERQAAEDRLGLLTPVVKGYLTDLGFDNAVRAQQVLGGHGYVEEWGMSQFVRDARIAMIYEGANGVQAMDLIGRKLPRDGGRAVMTFFGEIEAFCRENGADEAMKPYVEPLSKGLGQLQQSTMWFMQNALGNPNNAGAGATEYLHLMGTVALGYMWARMAKAALAGKARGNGIGAKMDAKLTVGRFYMERVMPEAGALARRIQAGSDAVMAMPRDMF
ncbi:MAG: acyl-CoA dehydrogenase, partial [Methylobacteriaceae bacterium]|nr:acyl-CoA dehydrogenase [Methylobacteriaceae bacterium]